MRPTVPIETKLQSRKIEKQIKAKKARKYREAVLRARMRRALYLW